MRRHGGAESIASETVCGAATVEVAEHATLARENAKTDAKQPTFEWFMMDEQKQSPSHLLSGSPLRQKAVKFIVRYRRTISGDDGSSSLH
ncbi:MAG TPA: hypothetical protein VN894_04760 [Polyangiaceae bacterium]|nr:hypothetical protein [Polyangiaceae bacterium]